MDSEKRIDLRRISWLKLHAILFILGMVLIWYNIIVTISYQGNASVAFDVFKPMIMERGQWALLWAGLLFLHFAALQFWNLAQRRARAALLQDEYDDSRLREKVKAKRDDAFHDEEEVRLSNLL